jgi:hypothetical protein
MTHMRSIGYSTAGCFHRVHCRLKSFLRSPQSVLVRPVNVFNAVAPGSRLTVGNYCTKHRLHANAREFASQGQGYNYKSRFLSSRHNVVSCLQQTEISISYFLYYLKKNYICVCARLSQQNKRLLTFLLETIVALLHAPIRQLDNQCSVSPSPADYCQCLLLEIRPWFRRTGFDFRNFNILSSSERSVSVMNRLPSNSCVNAPELK